MSNAASLDAQHSSLPSVTIGENSDFRPISSPDPRVIMILAPAVGTFPTFNVIRQPGTLTQHQERLAQETLTSYRESGFTDAKVVTNSSLFQSQKGDLWEVIEISYSHRGTPYTAQVGYLNLESEHLVATMIGQAANITTDREKWRGLLRTIKVQGTNVMARDTAYSNAPIFVGIAISLALGLGILGVFWKRLNKGAG